ncbi:DUF4262 domain-containing protein [Ensifer sp. ENS02]|uniref:DUF4262 domain-containing protein n=1 Tax=Ensifer sp. ENS02 TaxID=2769290 RepID=UPI001AEDFC16|nr:DUF4262 domain-containing protein [Ensifer sp. ENS02]
MKIRTALDQPIGSLDQNEQRFVAQIRQHGWFDTHVFEDSEGPGFSYSTGMWITAEHPELIVFGLKRDVAHDVLWGLYNIARSGSQLQPGARTDKAFARLPAFVFPVAKRRYKEFMGWSRFFYHGNDFPCFQIVWPDRQGNFPWEDGFEPAFKDRQPDLTEFGWRTSLNP